MAHYRAIAAAGAAICGLIKERYPRDEFGGSLSVETRDAIAVERGLSGEGFAVCLWRVTINTQRRARAPRTDGLGRRFKPSLPLDLSFLVIPHASSAERQARMLGWLLRTIEDAGPITAAQLNFYLAESDIFAPDEDAELVCDPLPLGDYLTLWDRFKKLPPAVNYLMRMVLIDSIEPITEGPPVVTREFQVGSRSQ